MNNYPATDMPLITPYNLEQPVPQVNPIFWILYFGFIIGFSLYFCIVYWKVFTKAGKPGWTALIPLYNVIVLQEIVGRPAWWFLLFFVPFVNIYAGVQLAIDTAKSFGKSIAFAILGLYLFNVIGWSILAFGNAKYVGKGALMK